MKITTKELIADVEQKLHLFITLCIFFPAALVAIFAAWGIKDDQSIRKLWLWTYLVIFALVSYLIFEVLKFREVKREFVLWVRRLLFCEFVGFIFALIPILSISNYKFPLRDYILKATLVIGVWSLQIIAGAICAILIVALISSTSSE